MALCIETRPDVCLDYIGKMRELGATRVELGVQIIDDKIYKKVKRGHTIKDVGKATEGLRNAGFKIGYHIMPGLPGIAIDGFYNVTAWLLAWKGMILMQLSAK